MFYENKLTITFRAAKTAENALQILKNRLDLGFDCKEEYDDAPAAQMMEDLILDGRKITLPAHASYFLPCDAQDVIGALLEDLASNASIKAFTAECVNGSEDDFGELKAKYANDVLKIKAVYFPNGYCEEYDCPECGETVLYAEEYEEGKRFFCPECGEEIDLSDLHPVITEKTIKTI